MSERKDERGEERGEWGDWEMGEGGNWGEGLEMVKKEKRAGRKREEMVGVESAREMDGAGGERE